MENTTFTLKVQGTAGASDLETLGAVAGFEVARKREYVENHKVFCDVEITYNYIGLCEQKKRGAGRKKKEMGTVEAARKMIEETSMQETAEYYGISVRTLQRRMKKANDTNDKYL